ncbi:hypothetical protein J3F84DRAFT_109146 [Trichoderma pleuroticola]|uniref:Uncharacterized protein n=1 Tax=Trichoderma harzianum TaxID=5544 RepID=A0A2K0U7P8_TRIHA|nr:hypothetical protein THARTR1_05933 [Trichoderma harzianum]
MVSLQANMQVHDDLAALFSRNMTFNPEAVPKEMPQEMVVPQQMNQPIVYAISQHYNHSAHIAKPQFQNQDSQRHSSEPPQSDVVSSETILRTHGVDPVTLTPSQLQLFRIADAAQRRRLVELWSICPPSSGGDIPALAWSSTTMEQEEHLAQLRYEQQQHNHVMSLDGTTVQASNSTWVHQASQESEPYMMSGYEEIMRREREREEANSRPKDAYSHFGTSVGGPSYNPSTDPVYLGADYARHQLQMALAEQYGSFEQHRGNQAVDVMDM